MKVVEATGYGGPEVLAVVDEPTPEPEAGQVRIDVRAAAVNPWDIKVYGGAIGFDPANLPLRIGAEVAGVVSAVGSDVDRWSVGDEVIAHPVSGGYADQVVTTQHHLVPKPANFTFEEASGLLLTGTTAMHALVATDVAAGDVVLVHGGSGSVGFAAVQLCVHRGARVIATAGARHHDTLREAGAEPVAYGEGLLERVQALAPEGVDASLDCVGTAEALDVALAVVSDKSRIVTIENFQGAIDSGTKSIGGGPGADPGTQIRREAQPEIARLAAEGVLTVRVDRTFALTEAAEAHAYVAGGRANGKVVLTP